MRREREREGGPGGDHDDDADGRDSVSTVFGLGCYWLTGMNVCFVCVANHVWSSQVGQLFNTPGTS